MIKNFFKNHHIHQKIVPYLDDIFIYNPTMFFTVWVMIYIGMYIGYVRLESNPQWITSQINIKVIFLFTALTLLMGAAFIKKQLIDLSLNDKQSKDSPLGRFIETQRATNIYKFSLVIGIGVLLFTNIYNLIFGLLVFSLLSFYFIYKNQFSQTYIDYLLIFLAGVLLILNGYIIISSENRYFFSLISVIEFKTLSKFIFYGLSCMSIFIIINILDSNNNDKILRLTSFLIMLIVFVFSVYSEDPLLSVTTLCSLPFLLYALFRNFNKDLVRAVRYPVFIFNFFVFTIFPYLSIPLLVTFYISKYYYWHRFNVHFPTFLAEND